MSGTKRGELVPNVGDLGAALLPHAKRSKTDRDASAAVAVDPHAAAAGAAATDEKCEMRKVFRAKSIWTRRYVDQL